MDLEIFKRIDDVIDMCRVNEGLFSLIAAEVMEHFVQNVFTHSKYTLSMVHRIKSEDSIREKLVRNSYISEYEQSKEILANFSDLIGFRIECKFIDDEKYVFELIKSLFTRTDDGLYFYSPECPKVRLKLIDRQPQKQRNGFNIYKLDGMFVAEDSTVRFELQIKALVNSFWGEIEHRIIYKNNAYYVADSFVTDLMTSIKKSLNMIDSQLYVLYKRFKRAEGVDIESDNPRTSIERFVAKMVHDSFSFMMRNQIGFVIDFRNSCDAVVRYIMDVNNADNMEDYGRVMLNVFYALNNMKEEGMRLDAQLEFERELIYEDEFSKNIYQTVLRLVNINFKWHMFFLVLFNIERGKNGDDLESFIRYYRNLILDDSSFTQIEGIVDPEFSKKIRLEIINAISCFIRNSREIEYFCESGIRVIKNAIATIMPLVVESIERGEAWEYSKECHLRVLKDNLKL